MHSWVHFITSALHSQFLFLIQVWHPCYTSLHYPILGWTNPSILLCWTTHLPECSVFSVMITDGCLVHVFENSSSMLIRRSIMSPSSSTSTSVRWGMCSTLRILVTYAKKIWFDQQEVRASTELCMKITWAKASHFSKSRVEQNELTAHQISIIRKRCCICRSYSWGDKSQKKTSKSQHFTKERTHVIFKMPESNEILFRRTSILGHFTCRSISFLTFQEPWG